MAKTWWIRDEDDLLILNNEPITKDLIWDPQEEERRQFREEIENIFSDGVEMDELQWVSKGIEDQVSRGEGIECGDKLLLLD